MPSSPGGHHGGTLAAIALVVALGASTNDRLIPNSSSETGGPGGRVGPPLADLGARFYLGGRITNTPGNLIRWIEDPRAVDPQTAMPTTGISKREARDMAAYLLTLR